MAVFMAGLVQAESVGKFGSLLAVLKSPIPSVARVILCHRGGCVRSSFTKIFLIHDAIFANDERHDPTRDRSNRVAHRRKRAVCGSPSAHCGRCVGRRPSVHQPSCRMSSVRCSRRLGSAAADTRALSVRCCATPNRAFFGTPQLGAALLVLAALGTETIDGAGNLLFLRAVRTSCESGVFLEFRLRRRGGRPAFCLGPVAR